MHLLVLNVVLVPRGSCTWNTHTLRDFWKMKSVHILHVTVLFQSIFVVWKTYLSINKKDLKPIIPVLLINVICSRNSRWLEIWRLAIFFLKLCNFNSGSYVIYRRILCTELFCFFPDLHVWHCFANWFEYTSNFQCWCCLYEF